MLRSFHHFLRLSLLLIGCMLVKPARATHIVGGEVTYKCVGPNTYEIRIDIYQDCLTGSNQAIADDNPAFIGIFEGTTASRDPLILFDTISQQIPIRVPPNFSNDCINNPPPTCLRKTSFIRTYTLPPNNKGYRVVYQRCCRNGNVYNIINPSEVGASYYCVIPPAGITNCNNSATFKNYPPQIICLNNPLVYDHSATDVDGDSLSYEFCQAYEGGSTSDVKPIPTNSFSVVTYRAPFSATKPMGGSPLIQIDPHTGLITGTPNVQGRFVVTVCCHEWKNGIMINTVTREFQFVVTDCSKAVLADMPQYSDEPNTYIVNCKDYTVHFDNTSVGGIFYHWDFGVEGRDDDTSSEFSPTFIYPDSGTYVVRLFVNPGSTCSDSISKLVKVYPTLRGQFESRDFLCPGDTISFRDVTSSTYQVNSWLWNYDDNSGLDSTRNTVHRFEYGGLYNVGLLVKNEKGCVDTVFKKILVDPFVTRAGRDTTIVKGEQVQFDGHGGGSYAWFPTMYLNDSTAANPIGTFPNPGIYPYILTVTSPGGCIGTDSVTVTVIDNPYLVMPNAFSPNQDGNNDTFFPIAVGYKNMKSFRIFNRYGEQIFYTNSFEQPWDGTYKGKQMDVGTYYWLLQVQDRHGNDVMLKGDVILLR